MKMHREIQDRLWTRGFFLLWQGQLVSTLGDAAYSLALGFWVLEKTGSTALMGTLMAASALPGILVSPFAGVWLDRTDKKPLLILMDMIRGLAMAFIAFFAYRNMLEVWMVFAAGITLSLCGALFRPGVNSSVPDLVPSSRLTNANSMLAIVANGASMLGNVAGGFLYQAIGAPLLFLFNCVSYFFSGASLSFVKLPKAESKIGGSFWADMREGFHFMWQCRGLRYLLMAAASFNFFSYIAIVLFLPLFKAESYLGAGLYGVAMALFMGGVMCGYLLLSAINVAPEKRHKLFTFSVVLSNLCLVAGANQHIFAIIAPCIFVGGFFNAFINVFIISTVQASTEAGMRGKALAFMSMVTQSLTPVAMALGGVLASFIPIKVVISFGFSASIAAVLPFCLTKPFREYMSSKGLENK